jgi:hypothetical protein
MKMPPLPEGQRWSVRSEMGSFIVVRLQQRQKFLWWTYWETIDKCSEYLSTGERGVYECVDHILNREKYDRMRAIIDKKKAQEQARIPWGNHEGGGK